MMILRKYLIKNIIKHMKYLIIIFSLFFNSLSSSKDIHYTDLLKKDGVFYEQFSDTPFTGKTTGFLEGKLEGELLNYNKYGKVLSKIIYKDGLLTEVIKNK